jgi:hypothetical protein
MHKFAHADGTPATPPPSLIIDGYRVHAPLTDEQLAKADIYRTEYRQPGPEWIVTGWTFVGIIDGNAVYEAEKVLAADEKAANLQLKLQHYGSFVARLAHHVAVLGHDMSEGFGAIMGAVITASAKGELTPEQQAAKGDAIDLYGILSRTLADDEIEAIWAAVKPKEDGE